MREHVLLPLHVSEWHLLQELCAEQRESATSVMRKALRLYAAGATGLVSDDLPVCHARYDAAERRKRALSA